MDLAVVYGYEADGDRVLLSDYWATDDPSVMPIAEAQEIGMFLERIDAARPRSTSVRAGLALAPKRWNQGIVDPDPNTGATYYYGSGGLRPLDRRSRACTTASATANGPTCTSSRAGHSARCSRTARRMRRSICGRTQSTFPCVRPALEEAATCYDRMSDRLGQWDPAIRGSVS